MTAVGTSKDAVALTANLSPRTEGTARRSKRGAGNFAGQIIRRVLQDLGLNPMASLVCEYSDSDRLHIHGVLRIPEGKRGLVGMLLKKNLAASYREIAKNKAILLKPITDAPGWASYSTKQLVRDSRLVYNSREATLEGQRFVDEIRAQSQTLRQSSPRSASC